MIACIRISVMHPSHKFCSDACIHSKHFGKRDRNANKAQETLPLLLSLSMRAMSDPPPSLAGTDTCDGGVA